MDLTILTRRGGVDWKGPGSLGKAETEDEGKSSCEKWQAVSAVLLVVAVCQNTPSEIQIHAKKPNAEISNLVL